MTKSNQGTPGHTPEQWNFYPKLSGSENHKGFVIYKEGRNTFRIADVMPIDSDGKEGEANARRIVACVNACQGVDTEELERTRNVGDIIEFNAKGAHEQAGIEVDALRSRVESLEKALRNIAVLSDNDRVLQVMARAALDGGSK